MTALLSPSIPATPPAAGPEPYRFTVAQYHAMLKAGILPESNEFEFIHGVVVKKMNKNPPHVLAGKKCLRMLYGLLPAGWHLQLQDPISLTDSVPEPDIVVVRGAPEDFSHGHPTPADVAVVAEVAASSLSFDRGVKRRMYASAGVRVYWIVNVEDNLLEVYTDPQAGDYATVGRLGPAEAVTLTLAGTALPPIPVRDLLP